MPAALFYFISIITSFAAFSQEEQFGPNDFLTTDTYEILDGKIAYGYIGSGELLDGVESVNTGILLDRALRKSDKFRITGYKVMNYGRRGSKRREVFYSIARVKDNDPYSEIDPVEQDVFTGAGKRKETMWVKSHDLYSVVGSDLANCDMLPVDTLMLDNRGQNMRPKSRRIPTLEQNLIDIAEVRDGIVDEFDIQVPALTDKGFNGDCSNFVVGENQLGPWGQHVVDEITGKNRGETYHVDVDPKFFFEVPDGYFGDACPNFNTMPTGQKLGLWVTAIAALSQAESSCQEGATNPGGTNNKAIGLLQNDAPWETRTEKRTRKDGTTYDVTIIGRENRGEGCNASTREPTGYMLHDYKDALSCGIQNLGDIACGGYSTNFGTKPVCRPDNRPKSFFGSQKVSNQEFGPLKGGTDGDKKKQAWIKSMMKLVPGCVD